MNKWFTVKVKYTKQLDNGTFKRVSEPYLLSAHTFTDAEARIYEELGSIIRGEFEVVSITRTEIQDIFGYDDADMWWKCKVKYDASEEESDKRKPTTHDFLVTAETAKEAYIRIQESLKGLLVDFTVSSIADSKLIDIFPAKLNLDKELSRTPIQEYEDDRV